MNSQVKFLIAVGIAMLGLAIVFTEVEGQSTTPDTSMLCNRTQYNLTGNPKTDSCAGKTPGTKYKSCSFCFVNNITNIYTYRYDYYICNQCTPNGPLCMYRLNCTGMPVIYTNNYTDIYNCFNPATQTCVVPTNVPQNSTVPPTPCQ
ncbi:unnamed protein product [Allacma fusca]|uniref:Uncharacterized protein n=1 Tax=Allacma fusca TaxID=39272 RepID=A0A8J2J7U2_9HEXA|nr:unnamed protein product [Allacma fusca]